MNLLLFSSEECEDGVCTVRDARAAHLRDVLRVAPGDRFQAGVVDGPIGVATVTEMAEGEVRFTLHDTYRSIQRVESARIVFSDVNGNRFEIPDLERLDARSRRRLELYL